MPPSVNATYGHRAGGRGRYKLAAYKLWLKEADAYYTLQALGRAQPIRGRYSVTITVGRSLRGDIDNRQKLVLDYLVSRGLTDDDRFCCDLRIRRNGENNKLLWIVIREER